MHRIWESVWIVLASLVLLVLLVQRFYRCGGVLDWTNEEGDVMWMSANSYFILNSVHSAIHFISFSSDLEH